MNMDDIYKLAPPFKIDGPGEYVTRDGWTVKVTRATGELRDTYPWLCALPLGGYSSVTDEGKWHIGGSPDGLDIIARASYPKPAPASKVRRYYACLTGTASGGGCSVRVYKYGAVIARNLSRADARAFAALKNATTPTTSKRKGCK